MKYKLKEGTKPKGKTAFRTKVGGAFKRVNMDKATQAQLAELHGLGHPLVVEDKSTGK